MNFAGPRVQRSRNNDPVLDCDPLQPPGFAADGDGPEREPLAYFVPVGWPVDHLPSHLAPSCCLALP